MKTKNEDEGNTHMPAYQTEAYGLTGENGESSRLMLTTHVDGDSQLRALRVHGFTGIGVCELRIRTIGSLSRLALILCNYVSYLLLLH